MHTLSQNKNPGHTTSCRSKAPHEPAASTASNTPPELGLGGVAFVIDQAGIIVAAEPLCSALFQWEPAELVGQPLEFVLAAGTDKIRQQLVPDPGAPSVGAEAQPRLFALAQRKNGTSFPAAVTLQPQLPDTGCWWAVAFHDVNSPPVAPAELRAAALIPPATAARSGRVQFAAPLAMDSIPDIFQRASAEPTPSPEAPAPAITVRAESPALARRMELSPEPVAPVAPAAMPAPAPAEARLQEREPRLNHSAADLKRTRAHLPQQDELLHAAKAAAQEAAAALEAETVRRTQVEEQLTQALQTGDELNNQLRAEHQSRAEAEARLQELEQRLAQTAEDLKRAQSQPSPVPAPSEGEPGLQEQLRELEGRLRAAVTSLARATAELETERGERHRSEQRAASLAARMQQLHEELKNQLAAEQLEHQHLTQLEHQLHEQAQQHDLAVAKLQSALQLEQSERQRLEAELLRSRLLPPDSARAGRAQVNGLRRQLQPSVESLHQAARRLLQFQLSEEQKPVVQGMLENLLLLQTSLQETPEA